jgi:dTDP-4-dehydrorhamnose reductase
MDRVLLTGASGFLGWNLAKQLSGRFQIYGTYLDHPVSFPGVEAVAFDLTDLPKIPKLCEAVRPQVIIHTAAYSNPDYCESNHNEALKMNTFATRELAKAASKLSCRLIYISTDFVFDGKKGNYSEADTPEPVNFYGKVKLLGELEVTNNCGHYVTLRIGTLYGRGNGVRKNFFETIEQQILERQTIPCLVDQYRTLLFVEDAVKAIDQFVSDRRLKGLFHLGGPEKLIRYEFAEKLCATMNASRRLLKKQFLADAGLTAARPKDCSLNSSKILQALNLKLTPTNTAIDGLRQNKRK